MQGEATPVLQSFFCTPSTYISIRATSVSLLCPVMVTVPGVVSSARTGDAGEWVAVVIGGVISWHVKTDPAAGNAKEHPPCVSHALAK